MEANKGIEPLYTKKQYQLISFALYIYATSNVVYMITQNVRAYIEMEYPDISPVAAAQLISFPTLFGLFTSLIIGFVALKFSKVALLVIIRTCMLAFSILMIIGGVLHAPFWVYYVGTVLCGISLGGFGPLMNSIVGEIFDEDQRASKISMYNVFVNIGGVIMLQLSGRIAAGNDGHNWPFAYTLGLWCVIAITVFLIMIKKGGYSDSKEARAARIERRKQLGLEDENATTKVRFKDLPKKVVGFVMTIAILHCVFYIGINGYYLNLSNYIITEHELGTSAQAGNCTSLTRVLLIVVQFSYPIWIKLFKDWLIPVGYAFVAVGLAAAYFIDSSMFGIYCAAACAGIATGLVHASVFAKALNFVPQAFRSISSSVAWGIANAGPFFATYVYALVNATIAQGIGAQLVAGIVIACITVVASIIIFVVKYPERKAAEIRLG
ncbi:MFS transporter [Eubacteriales bacterium DFI.9.88]|nr:MFS transporter [Eubacteriales bacterium DFI.9.88]